MKKIISLAKAFYKNNKNDSEKIKKQTKITLYLILGIYILFVFVNFWGLFITPLKEIGKPEMSISLMITLVSVFMFVTSITYVANVLYFSNDIENILPFPFKPKEIFAAKLFTVYIYELLISAMFLLPGFISYGYQMNEGIVFYIYAFIISLLLPIIPILVVTVVCTILMQFFKFVKYKNFFRIVTTVLLLFVIVVFEMNLNSNMEANGEYSSEYILNMVDVFNDKVPYYLEIAVNSMGNIGNFSGFISLLWFAIMNIAAVFVVILSCNKLYLKGVYYNLNGGSSKKIFKKNISYKSGSIYTALINKDIKNLFRNVTFFIQCVLPIFLMPVIILVMLMSSGEVSFIEIIDIPNTMMIVIGLSIIQIFMIMNYISVTAISRDGREEATFIKTLPINYEKLISAKAASGTLLGIIGVILAIVFSHNILQLEIYEIVVLLVIGVLLNVVQSYMGVLIDLLHPKYNCESELAIVKQNMNIFYAILIEFGMIIITFVFGSILMNFNVIYFVLAYLVFYLIVYVILKVFVKKNAEKLFFKIM